MELLILMGIPNFYQSKNYRLLILVPLALMVIGLWYIPHIQLDSSLRGGLQIEIQTNSSVNQSLITSKLDSAIPGAQASVVTATSGITITIAANTSLTTAQNQLLAISTLYGNYSKAAALAAEYEASLKSQPSNSTLQAAYSSSQANATSYLSQLTATYSSEIATLKPLLNSTSPYSYNASNPASMVSAAQSAETAAQTRYQNFISGVIQSIMPNSSPSYQTITPEEGSYFLGQMFEIVVAAFILVAIAVFFVFRNPVPSLTVVFGAANDIVVALGAMGLFGIPLGIASIGGLLMLIGYAIDTDLLSSIRIMKRGEGTPQERAFGTMKTGITMTSTAIISFGILFIVSYVAFIPTYFEISGVVLAGLIGDIFTTWFGNTPMILWYKLRKEVRK
jgi:preprotein translocase subunit SecF